MRRERTNTPLQALVTLNDPQFFEAAQSLAQAVMKTVMQTGGDNQPAIVVEIAHRVLCRTLNAQEASILLSSYQDLLQYYKTHAEDAQAVVSVGQAPPSGNMPVAELAAWTMVCNQVLNLDEVICK